ncbi:hypothetical protein LXL04_036667 [Taraxacum kok-saghyz]
MTMIRNLLTRFGRSHQLHTIISKEIIKPSSPTPSHLKTYNFTIIDQIIPHIYMPMITFYPNTPISNIHDKTTDLKKSLSQTLTKYYPFAGRYGKVAPAHVDCNDNGAEFFEASIDTTLSDFLQNSKHHQDIDQFFPYALNHDNEPENLTPLMVQVNHFECGGVAVAVSLSHKLADANSLVQFIGDWAKTTRSYAIDPKFMSFEYNINSMGGSLNRSKDYVTRIFKFDNSKINKLKVKVKDMAEESGQPITNLTRVEVLNWLLYTCGVAVTTKNNSGYFKPTNFIFPANIRQKMVEPLPEKSIGNFCMTMQILTKNESEMKPESFIGEFRKCKMQLQGVRNMESVFGFNSNVDLEEMGRTFENAYLSSSMCGFPVYEIDFGWGKPVKATFAGLRWKNLFILMDTPKKDGIEALVCLEKKDMEIFQSDPRLLPFI